MLSLSYRIRQPSHSAIFSLKRIQHSEFKAVLVYIYFLFFHFFKAQSLKTFTIQVLADSALEGEESFNVRLFPAQTDAVIDPLHGQFLHSPQYSFRNRFSSIQR